MLIIIGAGYHLAPTVIVFPLLSAFKMPFPVQIQYYLILPFYHWNVLHATLLTASG